MNTVTRVEGWGLVQWVPFLEPFTPQSTAGPRARVASVLYQLVLGLRA